MAPIIAISDDVMEKRLEETVVLLSVRTGYYYTLNATGGRMWQLLREGRPLGDVIDIVAAEHGEARDRVETDLARLVEDLAREGLVQRG